MHYFEDIELNAVRKSGSHCVTSQEIIDFASQWDPQPFHTDEEEAKNWPLGFCAFSLHTMAISIRLTNDASDVSHAVVGGLGWDDVRMSLPVGPATCYRFAVMSVVSVCPVASRIEELFKLLLKWQTRMIR